MKLSDERLEAAAQAVMREQGFVDKGDERLIDQQWKPRPAEWVALARAALMARPPRKRRSGPKDQ